MIPAAIDLNQFALAYTGTVHKGSWNKIIEGL